MRLGILLAVVENLAPASSLRADPVKEYLLAALSIFISQQFKSYLAIGGASLQKGGSGQVKCLQIH